MLTVKAKTGESRAVLVAGGREIEVLIGKTGVIAAVNKREGDGKTPLGRWQVLYGMYRADRLSQPPAAGLTWIKIQPDMGWCDAVDDPLYNQPVPKGYPASHEALWREDSAYDIVLVLDHNQGPVMPGAGSAVFVHMWRDDGTHTAGCVALKHDDMLAMLAGLMPDADGRVWLEIKES